MVNEENNSKNKKESINSNEEKILVQSDKNRKRKILETKKDVENNSLVGGGAEYTYKRTHSGIINDEKLKTIENKSDEKVVSKGKENNQTNHMSSFVLKMPGHTEEQIMMHEKEQSAKHKNQSNIMKYKYLTEINIELAFKKHKYGTSFDFDMTTIFKLIYCLSAFILFLSGVFIINYLQKEYVEIQFLNSVFLIFIKLLIYWATVFFFTWCLYILIKIIITSRKIVKLGAFIEFSLASFEIGAVLFFSIIVFERTKKACLLSSFPAVKYQYINYKYIHYWEKCIKIFINYYLNDLLDFLTNTINIYLIFNIFIVLVDGNLYFSCYKNKIRKVKPIVEFIKELHTINTTFTDRISLNSAEFDQYSHEIYDRLTDNNVLNINHFRLNFGVEKGNLFFNYFDPNFSQDISEEDFIRRHKSLILYSISLHKSLIANTNSIGNLKFITMLLAIIPISTMGIHLFSPTKSENTKDSSNEAVKTTGIVASGIAVGAMLVVSLKSVLEDIFYAFFYSYVVRPFDINDIIIINNKYSRCLELGIFKSIFLTEGKYEIIQTTTIGEQMVSTLESTKSIRFKKEKKFKLSSFDKYNEMKELIYEYLKFNPDKFRLKHEFYYLIEANNVLITVEYDCVCRFQEMDFANHSSKMLQTKFQDIIDTLEMESI